MRETLLAFTKEPTRLTLKPVILVPDPPSNIVNTGTLNMFFMVVPDLLIMFKGLEIFK